MFRTTPDGLLWGALFSALLLIGSVTDVRSRRIPNPLVLVIALAGLGFSVATRTPWLSAVGASAAGLGLGFGIWIAFWLVGLLGAGDVKFFAAAGVWLGPGATWRAALVAALLGGVLALVALARDRQLKSGIERTALAVSTRSIAVLGSTNDGESRRRHLPYGVALAAGALVVAWLPTLTL